MSPADGPDGSSGREPSFLKLFLGEMGIRMGMLLLAMALSVAGSAIGATITEGGRAPGAFVGLAVGIVAYAVVLQRFNRRPGPAQAPTPPDATGR